GWFIVFELDAREVLPEAECAVPSGGTGDAGARSDAAQARMAQDRDRAARDHGKRLHVHGEGVDLHAVDLVACEGAGEGIDADVLGFDIACSLVELAIEAGHLNLATFTACRA